MSAHRTRKWIERADCEPPNIAGMTGQAALTAGDMARPVRIITGNAASTTAT